jgi:tRNA threonylcarbamoyladenosine biosynthesis protein TsaB
VSGSGLHLALDTATDRPAFALGTPREPGPDRFLALRQELSREIENMVGRLLAERGARPWDLSGVVVADGPGSFTGLRIGIAFAKGICRAGGLSLLAAPSMLAAAASRAPGGGVVACRYDALRGEVYEAVYRLDPVTREVEVLAAPALKRPHAQQGWSDAALADESCVSAAALLSLVGVRGGAQLIADPASWEPAYGRLAEAEARRRARHGPSPDAAPAR